MHDAVEVLGLSWPQKALINAVTGDLPRCQRLEQGLSRDYLELPIRPLALHVTQVLAEASEKPVEQARLLNNLSVRLAENGDQEAGLEAIQRAVTIREKLAQDNFAAYGPDLPMSLSNLSNFLADSGDRKAGLEAIQRAVGIYEKLAQDNVAAYGPNLAGCLAILANFYAGDDHYSDAINTVQRAIALIRPAAIAGTTYADWLEKMKKYLADYQASLGT